MLQLLLVKDHEERENRDLRDRIKFSAVLRKENTETRVTKVAQLQTSVR